MPMGRLSPSFGIKVSPTAARDPAMKSQYLKKNRRARLKITENATVRRALPSSPRFLYRSTNRPWV